MTTPTTRRRIDLRKLPYPAKVVVLWYARVRFFFTEAFCRRWFVICYQSDPGQSVRASGSFSVLADTADEALEKGVRRVEEMPVGTATVTVRRPDLLTRLWHGWDIACALELREEYKHR